MTASRRSTLKALLALPFTAVASRTFAAVQRTPTATEGPFYPRPDMRFADADNNLVKIQGIVERAGGEVIVLHGRVLDHDGKPANGARVEIWQCDVNGRYLHTSDRGGPARDPAFQGFGHVVTGPDGTYAFRTIKPVPYPGRTPHIHLKVLHDTRELTTQLYIADAPENKRDGLYQRMSAAQQRAVSMIFERGADAPEATVDIRL